MKALLDFSFSSWAIEQIRNQNCTKNRSCVIYSQNYIYTLFITLQEEKNTTITNLNLY